MNPLPIRVRSSLKFDLRTLFSAVSAVSFCISLSSSYAQNPIDTGLLPYHIYQNGDIDHINLDTESLNVSIPLVSYPQRGGQLAMSFALVFNGPQNTGNSICKIASLPGASQRVHSCDTSWSPPSLVGGDNLLPNTGYQNGVMLVDTQEVDEQLVSLPIPLPDEGTYHTSQVVWLTADGGAHPAGPLSNGQIAMDGSGFQNGTTYSVSSNSPYGNATCNWLCSETGLIAVKNGISHFQVGQGPSTTNGSILRMDADGNYITRSSTQYVDTVGRAIPIPSSVASPTAAQLSSCGGPLPVVQLASWSPPGYVQPFLFCFANVTITLPWSDIFVPGTSSFGETSITQTELQTVVLPNQQKWTFQYAESLTAYGQAGGMDPQPGINTGDLTQITFPTGGTLSYTYAFDAPPPIVYAVNPTLTMVSTRTLNADDGTGNHQWTYTEPVSTGPGQQATTVTDPAGNVTTLNLQQPVPTEQINGVRTTTTADNTGKVWKTLTETYPWQYSSPKGFPLYVSTRLTTLDSGQSTLTQYKYCCDLPVEYLEGSSSPASGQYFWDVSNGKVIDEQVYDFSASGTGTLLRDTQTAYEFQVNSTYKGPGSFFDVPAQVSVYNGSEALMSQTTYGYGFTQPVASGITEQIATPLFTVDGRPTLTSEWLSTGNSTVGNTATYYNTGELFQTLDPLGYATTYGYSSTYQGALPTTITNALGKTTTNTYYPLTGQIASTSDPNGASTSFIYQDPSNRLTRITYADSGYTGFAYQDSGTGGVTVTQAVGTAPKVTQVNVDGLGRMYETELTSDPAGPVYTRTSYDALGRTSEVWNPSRCNPMTASACPSESTWGFATTTYDALGRTALQYDPDGISKKQWTYNGNQTIYTDEVGNQRQRTSDALGRLTGVLEPNGAATSPSMQTNYTYDALDNLLTVSQCGGPCATSSTTRTRTFSYDSLSRLLSAVNPESGTASYTYDADGNVTTKTSPAVDLPSGTQTQGYCYDKLNRLTYRFPAAPPSVCTAPSGYTESYLYDTSTIAGAKNVVGRMTDEKSYIGGILVSENAPYQYDGLGRLLAEQECPLSPCAAPYNFAYTYNYAGDLASSTNGLSPATQAVAIGYTYDAADRLSSAATTSQPSGWSATAYPPTLVSASGTSPAAYDPMGHVINASFGLGSGANTGTPAYSTTSSFDALGRVLTIQAGSLYSYTSPSGGYAGNGNLSALTDSISGTWKFSYDTLNRLTAATSTAGPYSGENGCWTYDAFGNRMLEAFSTTTATPCAAGAPVGAQYTATAPTALNRVSSFSYDGAGNVLFDGQNSYAYDVEGRLCAVAYPASTGGTSIVQYLYDAEGRRIAKGSKAALNCSAPSVANGFALTNQYLMDGSGHPATELNGQGAPVHSNVYADGGLLATYDFVNGGLHFAIGDPLGTKRVQVNGTGAVELQCLSLPFGNNIGNTRATDCKLVAPGMVDATEQHFTGKERDTESGLDYFGARYYGSSIGRFSSPDDSAAIYSDPMNPQSWNLNSYVQNNPLKNVDPDGHDCVTDNGNGTASINSGDCFGKDPNNEYYYNCDGCLTGTTSANITQDGSLSLYNASSNTLYSIAGYGNQSYGPLDGPANQAGLALLSNTNNGVEDLATPLIVGLTLAVPGVLETELPAAGLGIGGVGLGVENMGAHPSTPTGQRGGSPMNVPRGTNTPEMINGRQYTGHALDQMQSRGIPSSVVEDAIQNGIKSPGNTPGTTMNQSGNVAVVTNSSGGVVTVIPR